MDHLLRVYYNYLIVRRTTPIYICCRRRCGGFFLCAGNSGAALDTVTLILYEFSTLVAGIGGRPRALRSFAAKLECFSLKIWE